MRRARAVVGAVRSIGPIAARSVRAPRPTRAPLVTVVVATYNWSNVLRLAMRSALAQRYRNLELLVVGDGCTDDTEDVVRSFDDPRVRWLGLPENSGSQSLPNNAGIEAARGEIVAYLGHDDLWLPDHLLHLVAALERGPWTASTTTLALGPPGSNVRVLTPLQPYRPGVWVPPSALAHRRELVDEIGLWRDYREIVLPPDNEFLGRALASGRGFAQSSALTVLKFNSAWRRDSYRLRRDDEQAAYTARLSRPRALVLRSLADYLYGIVRGGAWVVPETEPEPDVVPPGWHVRQWRTIRGLTPDPLPGAPPADPDSGGRPQ